CRGEIAYDDAHPDLRHVIGTVEDLARETGGAFAIDADPTRPPDPAAYVKGWAVQRAHDLVVLGGATAACTNGGGDVVVSGGDRLWRIGVTDPRATDRLAAVVELQRGGVATSGTYERGRHLYDPCDGLPTE